ncbi:unnamed protein product [Ascophyllum nodosum]
MDRCMTTMSLPLLMVAVIELLLFRCDDAYFTIRPAAFIDAPALLRVPSRGKNCGARMLCGERDTTWSNPSGKDLVEIVRGQVWAAERPFIWNSIDVGGRMAVVKLPDGSLWVHSPVQLDEPLRRALEELGPVGHIVSPNFEHVKYAQQWVKAFPSARSYGCPGLMERHPEVGFSREVGNDPGDETPPEWGSEIETCFMDCETNPFTGKPFFNEVVFFHRPTKALMTADLYWNYPTTVPAKTQVWKWGMDKASIRVYLPFFKRFMVTDDRALAARVNRILDWGIDVIIPCHGDVVRSGASQALRERLLGAGPIQR